VPKTPKTVDEYLKALPVKVQKTLGQVRKAIKSAAPGGEEIISYGIPAYKFKGHIIIYFAAFKNHCSIYAMGYSIIEEFKSLLKNYDISGTTIHFPLDKPLPPSLVKKLVKARIKQNEERKRIKKK
jgi:uncharacterized protein YdhG (YjbR/CyaY superfamily)